MKSIRITSENSALIEAALASVNGRATAHAFHSHAEVAYLSSMAEHQAVSLLGSKKATVGAQFFALSGAPVPRSYGHARAGNSVSLVRRSSGWFLFDVRPVTLFPSTGGMRQLFLNSAQSGCAQARFRTTYLVA